MVGSPRSEGLNPKGLTQSWHQDSRPKSGVRELLSRAGVLAPS